MKIIITMAGASSRFLKVGITTPKYALSVNGRTLFSWSIESLRNFFDYEFIFLVQKQHSAANNVTELIREECRKLGITDFEVIMVDGLTKGQAETALYAGKAVADFEPILIYNIDTYVESEAITPQMIKGDGFLPVFIADGEQWSFLKFDEHFRVLQVAEKVRISTYATIGLYYFSSFGLFKNIYVSDPFHGKEQYIAPMYDYLITQMKKDVYTCIIDPSLVHALGTPEEVKVFCPEFKW